MRFRLRLKYERDTLHDRVFHECCLKHQSVSSMADTVIRPGRRRDLEVSIFLREIVKYQFKTPVYASHTALGKSFFTSLRRVFKHIFYFIARHCLLPPLIRYVLYHTVY